MFEKKIISPKIGYHCTTEKKLKLYKQSGKILAPVRFFPTKETAEKWAKKIGRFVIKIELENISYPLPDHKPAMWCNYDVYKFWRLDS